MQWSISRNKKENVRQKGIKRGGQRCSCDSSEDLNRIIVGTKILIYYTAEWIAPVRQEKKRSQDVTGIYIFYTSKPMKLVGKQSFIYTKYLLLGFWHPIPSL
jgi:hypothetical protein